MDRSKNDSKDGAKSDRGGRGYHHGNLAEALAARGGDSMARDATTAIRDAISRHDAATVHALARGHAAYGLARRQFLNDRLKDASATMSVFSNLRT